MDEWGKKIHPSTSTQVKQMLEFGAGILAVTNYYVMYYFFWKAACHCIFLENNYLVYLEFVRP